MFKKSFIVIIFIVVMIALFMFFMSQNFQKHKSDMVADSIGLDRIITHCIANDCKEWEGRFKIFPFPGSAVTAGGGGAAFQFVYEGKKIICGPGWRIIEK